MEQFSVLQVRESLKSHICDAAQTGLNNTNNNVTSWGMFEAKFQDKFVESFRGQQNNFPGHLGTIEIASYGRDTDDEARTGSDVCITWTYSPTTLKKDDRIFKLYLQLKILYNDYNHYYNTVNYNVPTIDRPPRKHNSWSAPYFDYEYRSTRQGAYFNSYQLLQMQDQMGDTEDDNGHCQVGAGFLLIKSAEKIGLAKDVALLPVQGIQMMFAGSYHYRLKEEDVPKLSLIQIEDAIKMETVVLTPQPNESLTKWFSNYIS